MRNEMSGAKSNSRWSPLGISLLAHCALITGLLFLPTGATSVVPVTSTVVTPLLYRPPAQISPTIRTLRVPPVWELRPAPLVTPVEQRTPKPQVRQFQAFLREQPAEQPKTIAIQTPEQVMPAAISLTQAMLATPDLPSRLAPAMPVKTNIFASRGTSPNGPVPASHPDVHTGGFGGADGSPVQSGTGKGNGAAVRTGGFGDSAGAVSGGSGSGNAKPAVVASAGFGNATVQNPAPHPVEAAPSETPVEVLWKPKPVYTDEARAKKLEGSVTLEVIFRATGQVEVLRVRSGLGSGLDQSARTAAEQIRFRPGKKDGVPVDKTGLVLITFELS
jgi:TonB family protein